jgi:ElaB/YqjD/DUF883 family membrane-anchored ribosome-binding protein
MNTDPFQGSPANTPSGLAVNQLPQTAREAVHRATEAAKDTYQTVRAKADETAARTGEYVRQHPMPSLLGAIAFGAALGYLLATARRDEPTFRERYVDEPLETARDAIFAVLGPVAQRLHDSFDVARDGAGKAIDKIPHFNASRTADSWADHLRRVSNNLKFW